jgi:hypothetical protein
MRFRNENNDQVRTAHSMVQHSTRSEIDGPEKADEGVGSRLRSRLLWPEPFRPMSQREAQIIVQIGPDWARLGCMEEPVWPGRVGMVWVPIVLHVMCRALGTLNPSLLRLHAGLGCSFPHKCLDGAPQTTTTTSTSATLSIVKHDNGPRIGTVDWGYCRNRSVQTGFLLLLETGGLPGQPTTSAALTTRHFVLFCRLQTQKPSCPTRPSRFIAARFAAPAGTPAWALHFYYVGAPW